MPYTITIDSNSNIAKNLVQYLKTFDFVTVTNTKQVSKKKTALDQPVFEEETPEQYEAIMALSKIANRNIARRLAKAKNLNLPFKNK
ncbi:hypothetical protein [Capnocytophaga sp. oral taxon 878]|uniref:hypothetical protein n=1 Tax=Capnocytophaga sp. oral taxon 878 TaxID=1316596 RepID=UPI000D038D1D|nr:hypothetical protein [Capnocytophaga sp. oral taxon 878]AVM49302.1 hypothetical protein C4H12_01785 [Capnocytophaga sp. oral taxon 878]